MGAYRWLLRLLPRTHRERFEHDMTQVFADEQRAAARKGGALGVSVLWMRELIGLVRFSVRERLGQRQSVRSSQGPGGRLSTELRSAWRGVRARGWRLAFVVLLLAVAMAANTLVFSAADAFVFHRAPYAQADRLAVIEQTSFFGRMDYQRPLLIKEWRKELDLFAEVHAHERGASLYLTSNGITETVGAQQVTPGLLEMLGVLPAFGRPFVIDDIRPGAAPIVIVSDSLARRLFGSPANALDQFIDSGTDKLRIVGIMPAGFRFPTSREEIWRPLDLDNWPKNSGVRTVARLASGRNIEDVSRLVTERAAAVAVRAEDGPSRNQRTSARLLSDAWQDENAAVIFAMLLGAAGCLFLVACTNVASVELQAASHRSRMYAVQAALGAPRGVLTRVALLEAALILGAATTIAATLVILTVPAVTASLTAPMRAALLNQIDLDFRALLFMVAIAAFAWGLTSLPSVLKSSRVNLADALREDLRVMPVTRRAARLRQLLMAAQVALTVMLLVGASLYLRTYAARLGLDKGFKAPGLVSVYVYAAADAPLKDRALEARVLDAMHAVPGLLSVSRTYELPPSTQDGIGGWLHVKGRGPQGRLKLSGYTVDPEYFSTMGIPLMAGRVFSETPGEMVVDDAFARKYWPNGDALGAVLRVGGEKLDFDKPGGPGWNGVSEFQIVGITSRLRADQAQTATGDDVFVVYTRLDPADHPLTFVARMHDVRQLPALTDSVRRAAVRSIVRTDTLENRYAALDADKRLTAFTTAGFGVLALIIATTGVYAVMAFLVSGRRREIGIRMALGADRRDVSRLVFGSSLRFVLAGAACGLGGALVASRWISGQLFGVTGTDPTTYAAVAVLVVFTAMAATWAPARTAALVDPAKTLRGE